MSLRIVALLTVALSVSACSTVPKTSSGANGEAAGQANALPGAPTDLNDSGSDLEGLPIEVNRMVLQWIDYFQGVGRPHMERYLQRSTRYMPIMKKILKENGLPEDLIYIALIESGFSSTAQSWASAVGYWQFIKGTGKRYGMQIDSYVDERRDFVRSTQAAADYYKGLYQMFGNWYLAIASYNVGENRVMGLVKKNKTRDFWKMARENRLPDETINYVPKFLAARLIAKAPEKYGFVDLEYMPPLAFSEVEFNTGIDIRKLATAMNLEYDDLRDLNPSYKRGVAFLKDGKLKLRVPPGMETQAVAAAPSAVAGSQQIYVADEDYGYYRVRRGDTIGGIARKFNTRESQIRELNNFKRGTLLIAGKRIRVPAERITTVGSKKKSKAIEREPSDTTKPAVEAQKASRKIMKRDLAPKTKFHVVKRGESLMAIAHKYRVSIRDLAKANRLGHKAKVSVGASLVIPR